MYQPKFFQVQELVPPSVFEERKDRALELIDERVLITLDVLRDHLGTCTVNDWIFGGSYTQSGLRTTDSTEYKPFSQHTFGRAMDCKFKTFTAEEARKYVEKHKDWFPYITFIEDDVGWFHFDVRNGQRLTLWSPETGLSRVV